MGQLTAEEVFREEFKASYSENDLFQMYLEENNISVTPETVDSIDEEHFKEFVEIKFEEYYQERLEDWH